MKRLLLLSILLYTYNSYAQDVTISPLLVELDKAVAEQQKYVDIREARISETKIKLENSKTDEERYQLQNALFNEYMSFVVDSALHYANEKLKSAQKLKKLDYIDDARLNVACVLILAGMYKEASDILQSINRNTLAEHLEWYYFTTYNTLYEAMVKYTIVKEQSLEYRTKAIAYKDSILLIGDTSTYIYTDKLLEDGNYQKALDVLEDTYNSLDPDSREIAYVAYVISDVYRRQGNRDKQKEYLIISAIRDMKHAVKEYISLRQLATLLYEEGDLDRAYVYMRRSQEDAIFCNARLRTIEVSQSLPIIDKAYQTKLNKDRQQTRIALFCITILSIVLIFTIIYVRIQMKRLSFARRDLKHANNQLQCLNTELNDVNEKLQSTNNQLFETNNILSGTNNYLSESNKIKEIYIAKFMTECSAYIDKMNDYRKLLNKQAATGKLDELYKMLKSPTLIEEELEGFYNTFDKTFLNLFPSFVEEFNSLFPLDKQITPKKEGTLTTELRIFALIRLGITDSEQIASFLRCSKATIYSYRSRLRLKSVYPEQFEERIMQIESF